LSELELERRMPATTEVAWRALTEPRALASWFWPASFATQVTAEVRVGGSFELRAQGAPLDGFGVGGTYLVVEPPARLDFSWRWHGEDEETSVEIELSEVDDGSLLVLRHSGFADEAERDQHIQGWNDCLDRLDAHLGEDAGRA
jgi:uncharacterized protein YndB with AHSA1/START domain